MEREEARDVTAPSPARRGTADMFHEGARLEAKDHMGEQWWEAKVLEVDNEGAEVLVHFAGWNGRHDEWIKMDSPRLQPYTRRSSRRRQSTGDNSGSEGPLSPRSGIVPPTPLYNFGDEVMALWQNGRKYPAVVQKMESDGSVSVQFYDGYVKSVRPINVRRLLASDSEFVKDCKEQQTLLEQQQQQMLATNGGTEANPKQPLSLAKASSPEPLGNLGDSAGPSKAKRERKSKFNVREVLNLKEASPKVTNMKDGLPSSKNSPALKPTSSSTPKLLKTSNPAERLDPAANSESYERSDKVFDVDQDLKNEEKSVEQQQDESQTGDIEVVDLSESFEVKSMSEGGCSVSEAGSEGTPSEKENINCENSDNFIKSSASDNNGIVSVSNGTNGLSEMIRGKRARKRKRFADEELGEGQSAKHQRSLSTTTTSESSKLHSNSIKPLSSSTGSPVKLEVGKEGSKLQARIPHTSPSSRPLSSAQRSLKGARSPSKSDPRAAKSKRRAREKARLEETRRDSEARTLVTPQNNNSTTTNGASEPALLLKTPAYLNFDFSLPPDQLLAQLEEGVTVPGPTTPLTMASPKLPSGWTKRVSLRSAVSGLLTKWDVTIESPDGRSFRNRQELSRHFEEARMEHNLDLFDFGLDTPLKKIRQIWKANLPVPQDGNKMSSPTTNSAPINSSLPTPTSVSSAVPTPSPEQKPRKPLRLPASDQERQKLEITMRVGPLSPATPVIGNASETGQGVRCPLKKCNKLFRNERLLLQHVKHYHPEYTEVVGYSPSVTDLAFQRTRLREEVSDSGGILLETLRKAEKKVEKVDKSMEKVAKIEKVEKLEKSEKKVEKVERSPVVTTVCTTPTPVVEVQELRKSLAAANSGDSCETSSPSKAPSTASKVTPLSTSKAAIGNHRGLVSTVESTTPALSEEENSTPLQAPPKRLSVDVRRLEMGECPPLPSPDLSKQLNRSTSDTPRSEAPRPRPKRLRTDSLLSVGTEGGNPTPPPSPPPPPSYKLSRRRAQQLRSQPGTPVDGGSPRGEEGVQAMEEDEVVNCRCHHPEGDGMMVQCEVCLTWQHGACIGVDSEEQVPENYTCSICRDPPLGRQSALYSIHHEWIREGSLPSIAPSLPKDATLKQLSSLMADLCALSSVLHSLQVKLAVAAQKSNPKVFMWSSPWDASTSLPPVSSPPSPQEEGGSGAPDLFPPNMESLLGGVEEERREQGEENFGEGTLKATSDNKHEEEPCEPQGANTTSSTSPNTDVTSSACPSEGPGGGTHNSKGSSVTSDPPVQGLGVQELESAEVRNPAPLPNPEPDLGDGPKVENENVCEKDETGGEKEGKCEDSERISGSENEIGVSQECPDKSSESEEAGIVGGGSSTAESNISPPGTSSEASKPGETDPAKSAAGELSKPAELSSELANLFSGELPSVSELQLLLPGVIQDISQGSANHAFSQQAVRGTNPTLIPEPKRLDREECRLNLLNHVEELQVLVEARLEEIENRLDAVDPSANSSCSTTPSTSSSTTQPPYPHSASSLGRVLLDLRTAKKLTSTSLLNNILPD